MIDPAMLMEAQFTVFLIFLFVVVFCGGVVVGIVFSNYEDSREEDEP